MSHPHHEVWIRLLEIDSGGVAEGRISQLGGRWRGERDVSESDMVSHSGEQWSAPGRGLDVEDDHLFQPIYVAVPDLALRGDVVSAPHPTGVREPDPLRIGGINYHRRRPIGKVVVGQPRNRRSGAHVPKGPAGAAIRGAVPA